MTDINAVLNRRYAIDNGIDPTGRKWGLCSAAGGYGLFVIGIVKEVDGEEKVAIPANYPDKCLTGMFTSQHKALETLNKYLEEFWNKSDSTRGKNARRNNSRSVSVAASQEEDDIIGEAATA